MEKYIDLHTHSNASDGSMSPAEVVEAAFKAGLSAFALTDHDTFDGVGEASEKARELNIELIPGIEISVDYSSEMHILGYFPSGHYEKFEKILAELREYRNKRNPKIVRKLNEMGFPLTMDEVRAQAKGSIIGRPHIARALVKKGLVKSFEDAFKNYLAEGKPAYFKREELSVSDGIHKMLESGGIPVLAHPILLNVAPGKLDPLLGELKSYGLAGMEVHYSENRGDDTGNLLRLAIKHDLIATGGSDFHGTNKPHIQIGTGRGNLKIPYAILDEIRRFKPQSWR